MGGLSKDAPWKTYSFAELGYAMRRRSSSSHFHVAHSVKQRLNKSLREITKMEREMSMRSELQLAITSGQITSSRVAHIVETDPDLNLKLLDMPQYGVLECNVSSRIWKNSCLASVL